MQRPTELTWQRFFSPSKKGYTKASQSKKELFKNRDLLPVDEVGKTGKQAGTGNGANDGPNNAACAARGGAASSGWGSAAGAGLNLKEGKQASLAVAEGGVVAAAGRVEDIRVYDVLICMRQSTRHQRMQGKQGSACGVKATEMVLRSLNCHEENEHLLSYRYAPERTMAHRRQVLLAHGLRDDRRSTANGLPGSSLLVHVVQEHFSLGEQPAESNLC
jgi:hypothetical protein